MTSAVAEQRAHAPGRQARAAAQQVMEQMLDHIANDRMLDRVTVHELVAAAGRIEQAMAAHRHQRSCSAFARERLAVVSGFKAVLAGYEDAE